MDDAGFVAADCPDEADGGLEPANGVDDAEMADNPLDAERGLNPAD